MRHIQWLHFRIYLSLSCRRSQAPGVAQVHQVIRVYWEIHLIFNYWYQVITFPLIFHQVVLGLVSPLGWALSWISIIIHKLSDWPVPAPPEGVVPNSMACPLALCLPPIPVCRRPRASLNRRTSAPRAVIVPVKSWCSAAAKILVFAPLPTPFLLRYLLLSFPPRAQAFIPSPPWWVPLMSGTWSPSLHPVQKVIYTQPSTFQILS